MKASSRLIASILAFCSFGSLARAQSIDDDMKCQVVNTIMVSPTAEKGKTAEVVAYIETIMKALDRAHGSKGNGEILPQMTGNGQSAIALVAVDRCRSHPDLLLADTAVETYEALRAMQSSLGLKKAPLKSAQSEKPRETGVPHRGTPPASESASLARLFEKL